MADYLQFVKASQPNVFESLCDSVSSVNNKLKRVRKSVDRTLNFLDSILTAQQENKVSIFKEMAAQWLHS